jgi:5,6-dimethylbenzimidazole synthase
MTAASAADSASPPVFDEPFRAKLKTLIAWRRDVRRFADAPVPAAMIEELLDIAQLSASVGNSQPWRWVQVDSPAKRAAIRANFCAANEAARKAQAPERAPAYATLKLEGIDKAPYQFAVFCDEAAGQGFGVGRHSMPETLDYSTVVMIATFWLAARAAGLGVGWVSILDPVEVGRLLQVPPDWKLVAYLCVGWPEEEHADPELERYGWQKRTNVGRQVRVV